MPYSPTGSSSIPRLISGHANEKIEAFASYSQIKFQTEIPTETHAKTEKRFTITEQNHDLCMPYI